MGVDGRIVENALVAFVVIGVVIGLGLAGLIWFLVWLFGHIDISWVSG